jgi:signal transduction histidine kinase
MLLASQLDAGKHIMTTEEINLTSLVDDCVADFITRYPNRIFDKVVENDCFIHGDMLMLQIALNNLIDNAIKYSPKDAAITILLQLQDQQIQLQVQDQGKGIEAAEKKKVFDKFYRVGNEATKGAKGTGLGLYLTKKIADQHHASIFVTDNTPTGSSFAIVFQPAKDNV